MSAKKRKWGKFLASDGKTYYMPKRFREDLVAMMVWYEKIPKYYLGRTESVFMYDRALNPEEIALLYESPFAMFRPFREKSLLWLIWRFIWRKLRRLVP